MPVWILKPHASYLSSISTASALFCLPFEYGPLVFSRCQAPTPALQSLRRNHRERLSQSLKWWPEPPCPTSPSPDVFLSNLLSLCQSKIGQPLTSPAAPPDNLLPLPVAWLNPGCQSAVLFSALHAPVRCRLVTGYLGFTHCCCACLFICSLFHGSKKQSLLPLYPFPSLLSVSSPPSSPFSSTHSTILPLPPHFLPYLLLIPSS